MAFQSLTLGAAITANQVTNVSLTQVSGAVVLPAVGAPPMSIGVPVLIDTEFAFVVSQPAAGVYTLRGRGSDGTAAVAHDVLSNVYASLVNDFGNPPPGFVVNSDPTDGINVSLGQDATIVVPNETCVFTINKASAAALVLPAPPLSQNGLFIVITSNTAFAHVVTATALLADGAAGSPHSTATFVAAKGASISLVAENGCWAVNALQNVTVS